MGESSLEKDVISSKKYHLREIMWSKACANVNIFSYLTWPVPYYLIKDLNLWAVIILDKIQKGIRIEREEHQRLKKLGLVEGRYPNIFISARVAAAIGQKAKHIRYRGLNHQYYRDLIIELIRQHGPVPREEINRLLLDKLPEGLTSEQKAMMIHNLLSDLRIKGAIKNVGSRRFPKWKIN
jgi:ATP-dependent DNA helicase RecG